MNRGRAFRGRLEAMREIPTPPPQVLDCLDKTMPRLPASANAGALEETNP